MVSLCCETDFVAKNEDFGAAAETLLACGFAAPVDNGGEALMDVEIDGKKFSELLTDTVSKTGEKTEVGDFERYTLSGTGVIGSYVHFNNKVGAMVEIEASSDDVANAVTDVANGICMHIAAMNPVSLDSESFDPAVIEKERAIAAEQVKDKPANIIDKIVDGKIGKFLKENCLVEQPFVKDDSKTVGQTLTDAAKAAGGEAKIKRFVRIEIG
jgi:elongation factor Ts